MKAVTFQVCFYYILFYLTFFYTGSPTETQYFIYKRIYLSQLNPKINTYSTNDSSFGEL